MAERTKGGGYRERIYFDDQLWHEIELVADHMKLEPRDLVKMLTAMGLAQMKGLTMMHAMQAAIEPVIQQVMVDDFERTTGMSANTPLMGSAPARPAPARPGRDEPQQQMVRAPQQQMVRAPQQQRPVDDGGMRYQAATYLENPRR